MLSERLLRLRSSKTLKIALDVQLFKISVLDLSRKTLSSKALANALKTGQQAGRERRSLREAFGDDLSPEHFLREAVKTLPEDGLSENKVLEALNIQELWT